MNNALLYLGGILITALAVLFAVPRFVDWNSYRGVFEEEASRILGREVRVGGAVNVRLVPAPFVSFEKLRIADTGDEGGNSIIRVESFTMWLSIPPLLRGVLEANRVELRRPVLNLAVNAEGSGNWRTLAISPGALPFAPKEVALQHVAISDGAVLVHTQDRGELARFDAINGELNAEALDGPFKFRGTVNWNESPRNVRVATAKLDDNGQLRFKAAVDVIGGANSYVLDARLSDLKTTPTLTGDLTAKLHVGKDAKPADGAPDVTLEAEPERKADAAPGADPTEMTGLEAGQAGETAAAAPASVPTPAPATAPADTAQANTAKAFELKAKVTGTALGVALDDVAVSLEAGSTPQLITGQAKFDWTDRTRLDVNLASRWLDLDGLAKTSEAAMPLDAVRSYFEMVAAALPAEADTNALLEFDQLTLAGEPISNVRLAASRSGGPLELKGVRADLPGGVRLELDGVLTPRARAPDLDGTLFVSGKSLMRFLAWGLGNQNLKRERTDGPFSLDGHFALGDGTLALTNASAVFQDTPLEGDLKLALGERKRLAVAISGPRIDVAQFKGGLVDLNHLRHILFGADAGDESTDAPAGAPFDPAGGDLALDLKVAELVDGERRLKDVDADIRLERGKLSIPRLKFATAEGLYVEAEGEASDVPANPKGAVRGLISAPDAEAAHALLALFDADGEARDKLNRLAGLAPFRLAGTLKLAGGPANASALAIDGKLGGGRLSATLNLGGGRAKWRTSPLDLEAAIDSPDVARLVATLFDARIARAAGEPPKSGRVIVKAAGVPANGLLSFAEATGEGLAISYRGDVSLPEGGATGLDGEVKIAVPDARTALAIAGLGVADGAGGIPLKGTLSVRRKADVLTIDGEALALGASTVSGQVAVTSRDDGRKTIDAKLTADKATLSAALAPLLSEMRQPDMLASAEPTPAPPPRTAPEPEGETLIWPEQAFDLAALDRLDGKIALTAGELSLERGLTIGNAKVEAELSPQGINVTRLEGDAVGGKLQSEIELTRAPAGVGLKGSLRIDVTGKSAPPGGDAEPSGEGVAFSVKFAGRALSPAAVVTGLTGDGEVTVGDVTLTGNSPAAVSAVARAALTGQGPRGGAPLADAMRTALKEGEVRLGKVTIPVEISDGALKLKRVQIDMPEGRSSFVTAVELQTMKIDSEWQVEPKLDKSLSGAPDRALLPPVTVVYTGKLSEFAALEPQVSAEALERELVVRKMELDVRELERLRKLDEDRARQDAVRRKAAEERARIDAERRRALEEDQAPNAVQREELAPPPGAPQSDMFDNSVRDAGEGVPVEQDIEAFTQQQPPVAAPAPTAAQRPPPRRKKPPEQEWRPFQITPY
ncbi:AsmA family protein [Hyphomicrobium sp. CS1GBMeth3]|uniref:AsmA family protein n=1 Tax=Hyphomicrobium sp. CS1GBMeth3 TaxID=1892845 RepID=UPI00093008E7|nr:AsmA family protein [Hyphomicrobium sp. CS1GBMeth3]